MSTLELVLVVSNVCIHISILYNSRTSDTMSVPTALGLGFPSDPAAGYLLSSGAHLSTYINGTNNTLKLSFKAT